MTGDEKIYAGDEETVAMLYQKLGRPALSKTMRLINQQGVAEEIVHDVFVTMWQKKPVFESLRSAYAWVYRCCTNKAIDFLRSKAQKNIPFEHVEQTESVDPLTEDQLFLKETLLELVQIMDERETSVLIYKYVEELGQEEMAEVMGVSRSTIVRLQNSVSEKLAKHKERHRG